MGEVLNDSSLRDLLTRALNGAPESVIHAAVDQVGEDLEVAVARRERSVSTLTPEELDILRSQMTMSTARRFQPTMVQEFCLAAMSRLRGDIATHGSVWVARHVPERVRTWSRGSVRARYDSLTFERQDFVAASMRQPELVSPGHPLLMALFGVVIDEYGQSLTRGVILDDDRSSEPYVVVSVYAPPGDGSEGELITLRVMPRDLV